MSSSWTWRQAETAEDAVLYVDAVAKNQPQYYARDDLHAAYEWVAKRLRHPSYSFQIGRNERGELAAFRIAFGHVVPTIEQYGADGPNWLTAFARGVPAVRDRMAELGIDEYDLAEVRLDRTADEGPTGRLLDSELQKLTTGSIVIGERSGSSANSRRYKMRPR